MDQLINHKLKIDYLITNNTSLNHPTHTAHKPKCKYKKCNECNRNRKYFNEKHQLCHICCKAKAAFLPSGNKVIDDFIRHTLTHVHSMKMEFVPYDRFEDVEYITEGGFSKIYKATWIDGPIVNWNKVKQNLYRRKGRTTVALKELSNSNNINSKDLNEVQYLVLIFDYKS